MSSRRWSFIARGLIGLAWLLGVGGGMRWLGRYESTPWRAGETPGNWPAEVPLVGPQGRPILLLALHPRCPCSRASVAQLARVMARCEGRLSARALVFTPVGAGRSDWGSELLDRLRPIPGVSVVEDRGGITARRFGAFTSGHAVLYDPTGQLLFTGGLTAARGHAADNAASDTVVLLATGGTHRPGTAPVFGCPILITAGGPGELPR